MPCYECAVKQIEIDRLLEQLGREKCNFPVVTDPKVPVGNLYFLPKRQQLETDEQYARRCVVLYNTGKTPEPNVTTDPQT